MARVLVTGGAGYVGSHCAHALHTAGHECVVFDDLYGFIAGVLGVALSTRDLSSKQRFSLVQQPTQIAMQAYAVELMSSAPDLIVTSGTSIVVALKQATRAIPIVFCVTIDPIGQGLVSTPEDFGTQGEAHSHHHGTLHLRPNSLRVHLGPAIDRDMNSWHGNAAVRVDRRLGRHRGIRDEAVMRGNPQPAASRHWTAPAHAVRRRFDDST